MGFKENLKEELKYNDMQIKELAQKIGVSKNTIANYLTTSNTLPNIETAVKIAQELNTTVEYLVTGKEITPDSKNHIINEITDELKKMEISELKTLKIVAHALGKN